MALGEQFSALDLDDDNDSGHGQSDSEDDASDEMRTLTTWRRFTYWR
jgi:hypothetical protein